MAACNTWHRSLTTLQMPSAPFSGFQGPLAELSLYSVLQVPTARPTLPLAVLCGPGVPKVRCFTSQIPTVPPQDLPVALLQLPGCRTVSLSRDSWRSPVWMLPCLSRGCWGSELSFWGLWPSISCVSLSLWEAIRPSRKTQQACSPTAWPDLPKQVQTPVQSGAETPSGGFSHLLSTHT